MPLLDIEEISVATWKFSVNLRQKQGTRLKALPTPFVCIRRLCESAKSVPTLYSVSLGEKKEIENVY